MKVRTKSEWEEMINEFGENVKSIIKDYCLEGKTTFEIEQEYKINKRCLHNLKIMFYDFIIREENINELGENVKNIIKDRFLEGEKLFDIEQKYKTNECCLKNLIIMFYGFMREKLEF